MPRPRRKHGRAVAPITDEATGKVLGWTYEWDNGQASRIVAADVHPRLDPGREEADAPQA